MSRKYKFHNPSAPYFVTFATVNWIDVFTREIYLQVLADSVGYCREYKGMELFVYCFMPSHVHFNFRDANQNPAALLRDFKKHTAKKVLEAIENNPQESRKEWLLWMFEREGKKRANTTKYLPILRDWQHTNKPIALWSTAVIKQKIDYIHNNPVEAGFVTEPTQWKYSSARNIAEEDPGFEIDEMGFLA